MILSQNSKVNSYYNILGSFNNIFLNIDITMFSDTEKKIR